MKKEYLVQYKCECPKCNGNKYLQNPDWDKLAVYMGGWDKENKSDEKSLNWYSRRREAMIAFGYKNGAESDVIPEEQLICFQCDGTGFETGTIPLKQALLEIENEN